MRKKIILLGMVVVLMFGILGCGNVVYVGGQKMKSYTNSHGGGMLGGYGKVEVAKINDEVYLIYCSRESYAEDDVVVEYAVDKAILEDIEAVFRKYKMNWWNQKKFTNMFVADGESYSYEFTFDDGERVSFSSQIYPKRYSNKLAEIDEIIEKYKEDAVLLPGLVVKEKTSEEYMYIQRPDNGTVEIEIYEYCSGYVYYRIMNGTEEAIEVPYTVRLFRDEDGAVLFNKESVNSSSLNANTSSEEHIRLDSRLEVGTYTIQIGEYEGKFEIK